MNDIQLSSRCAMPAQAHSGQRREVNSPLHLQRTIGNQAMRRSLQSRDAELEVELASTSSVRFAHDFSQIPLHPKSQAKVQAKRTAGDLGEIAVPPIVAQVLSSPGQPLDTATRSLMGARFGYDFSRVRIHNDQPAARSAESVAALAYTVGSDVVFGVGRYAPESRDGQRLLAHELTHVVQQGGAGRPPGLAQEQEAEAASKAVEMGVRPRVHARSLVGLAAQSDSSSAGLWPARLEPMGIKPDPFEDSQLGLRIVDPSEIEAKVRRILLAPGGWVVAQCKADFSSRPQKARVQLERSHWRNDHERLLYARCYFERFLGSGGEGVDSETLVRALVNYEVQVQGRSADLVVQNPLTLEDQEKLGELRKQKAAENQKRHSFEGPLTKARQEFFFNNESSFWNRKKLLRSGELTKVADAVVMTTREFANSVPLEFFKYYSDHMLMKMDKDEEKEARKTDTYALTDPGGDTRLRSDVTSFPEGKLGPLLLHELGHTQDAENAMGLGGFQEGHGYAVEYFFSKDMERKAKILDILSSDVLAVHSQRPALRQLFHVTLATLIALTEVIQRGSSSYLPANIMPNAEAARRLIAERVVKSQPSSDQLKAITRYVTGHLGAFNLPSI